MFWKQDLYFTQQSSRILSLLVLPLISVVDYESKLWKLLTHVSASKGK